MNREIEILFRGKRLDNGQWVYGDLYHRKICGVVSPTIHNIEYTGGSVDPATIGQYIGLTDKNGNKIFEGDIIRHTTSSFYGVVTWNSHGYFYIKGPSTNDTERDFTPIGYMLEREDFEIIGNINDNLDLLKE